MMPPPQCFTVGSTSSRWFGNIHTFFLNGKRFSSFFHIARKRYLGHPQHIFLLFCEWIPDPFTKWIWNPFCDSRSQNGLESQMQNLHPPAFVWIFGDISATCNLTYNPKNVICIIHSNIGGFHFCDCHARLLIRFCGLPLFSACLMWRLYAHVSYSMFTVLVD